MMVIVASMIFVYMSIMYLFSRVYKNNTFADVGWGIGFMLIAFFSSILAQSFSARAYLVSFLVYVWGIRISYYLFKRTWQKPEDRRYQELRIKWGDREPLYAFFFVFMLQAILMLIIGYPIVLVHAMQPVSLTWIDGLVVALWVCGMFWEAVGDYQLKQFTKNPLNQGRIMQTGLWRYTRHPNYFGESVMWWALFFLVFPVAYGWTTIVSPLLITFLLVCISGIPLAEKEFAAHKEYQEYKKRTSAFIPLPVFK